METLQALLRDPTFWLVTVFLALVLSVVGAYLKDGIDRLGSSLSKLYRTRTQQWRSEREMDIDFAIEDQTDAHFWMFATVAHGIYSLVSMLALTLLGLILVAASQYTPPLLSPWSATVVLGFVIFFTIFAARHMFLFTRGVIDMRALRGGHMRKVIAEYRPPGDNREEKGET